MIMEQLDLETGKNAVTKQEKYPKRAIFSKIWGFGSREVSHLKKTTSTIFTELHYN